MDNTRTNHHRVRNDLYPFVQYISISILCAPSPMIKQWILPLLKHKAGSNEQFHNDFMEDFKVKIKCRYYWYSTLSFPHNLKYQNMWNSVMHIPKSIKEITWTTIFSMIFAKNSNLLWFTNKIVTVWLTQIAKFMGLTWGPPGSCQPQMGPMLAP